VRNEGYLPTYMTERALERETVTPVTVTLSLPDGVELVMGSAAQDLGHLAGRDERTAPWSPWLRQWNTTARKAEWLVRAAEAALIGLTAESRRAGTHRAEVQVG
jgi:hypothetical protein